MISCQELRTGNFILVNDRLRKVTFISNNHTSANQSLVGVEDANHEDNEKYTVEDIQPVPMSEAILLQCHFSYQQHFNFWQLIDTDGRRTEMNIDPDYTLIDFMRRPVVKNIASLHQLQNIYYMLFNKELNFDAQTTALTHSNVSSMEHAN